MPGSGGLGHFSARVRSFPTDPPHDPDAPEARADQRNFGVRSEMKGNCRLCTDLAWLWPMWGAAGSGYALYRKQLTGHIRRSAARPVATLPDVGCEGGKNILNPKQEFTAAGPDVSLATPDETAGTFQQNRTTTTRGVRDGLDIVSVENLYDPDPAGEQYEATMPYPIREHGRPGLKAITGHRDVYHRLWKTGSARSGLRDPRGTVQPCRGRVYRVHARQDGMMADSAHAADPSRGLRPPARATDGRRRTS